jgi:hypothetical protein
VLGLRVSDPPGHAGMPGVRPSSSVHSVGPDRAHLDRAGGRRVLVVLLPLRGDPRHPAHERVVRTTPSIVIGPSIKVTPPAREGRHPPWAPPAGKGRNQCRPSPCEGPWTRPGERDLPCHGRLRRPRRDERTLGRSRGASSLVFPRLSLPFPVLASCIPTAPAVSTRAPRSPVVARRESLSGRS